MVTSEKNKGPVYGVPLIETMQIGGGMKQAMPSRIDLQDAMKKHMRVVAGYEVLLSHYRKSFEALQKTLAYLQLRADGESNELWVEVAAVMTEATGENVE